MSNEQLLAQAREKYPIWTIVKGWVGISNFKLIGEPQFDTDLCIRAMTINLDNNSQTAFCIYNTKEWAEIVPDWQPKEGEMVTHPDKICPIDMPSVGVKKGDVFHWNSVGKEYFSPAGKYLSLPLELVESWENVPTEDEMWRDVWDRSCESVGWFFKYVQSHYNISRK